MHLETPNITGNFCRLPYRPRVDYGVFRRDPKELLKFPLADPHGEIINRATDSGRWGVCGNKHPTTMDRCQAFPIASLLF